MCSKRKSEKVDFDLAYLHGQLSALADISSPDAKCFLLFIKSLNPNSPKLKIMEYSFAKGHGDVQMASQQLSHLCSSHAESINEEVVELFDSIRSEPPDNVSVGILNTLPFSTQRDLLNIYLERCRDNLLKADILLRLFKVVDVHTHTQLLPTLLSLIQYNLKEGEDALLQSVVTAPEDDSDAESEPSLVHTGGESSDKKNKQADESEEGEVTGDDEEEEEDSFEPKPVSTRSGQILERQLLNNAFRLKLVYQFMPVVCKACEFGKVDRKLLDTILTDTFSFLFSYLSTIPEESSVLGSDKTISELYGTHPKIYVVECLRMLEDTFQPAKSIFVSGSHVGIAQSYALKDRQDLVSLFEDCLIDLRRAAVSLDTPSKKRRSHSRKSESQHSILKSVLYQSAALFWYLFIELTTEYLKTHRPSLFQPTLSMSVTSFPLNLQILFASDVSESVYGKAHHSDCPIMLLARLLSHQSYNELYRKHSSGCKELDHLLVKLGPRTEILGTCEVSLITTVFLDLLLLSGSAASVHIPAENGNALDVNKLLHTCTDSERQFIMWISSVYCELLNGSDCEEDIICRRSKFLRGFAHVVDKAPVCHQPPVFIGSGCWTIPLTRKNVQYIGCRAIASWLSSLLNKTTNNAQFSSLKPLCIMTVLCQLDSLTDFGRVLCQHYPLPYDQILSNIRTNWCHVRSQFASWVGSSSMPLVDGVLLNKLIGLEVEYRTNSSKPNNLTHPELLADLMKCLKFSSCDPVEDSVCRLVESESAAILSCIQELS